MGDFLDGCADCKQDHPTPTTFVFMMSWHMAVCPSLSPDDFQPPLDKLLPWKEIPEGFRATPTAIDKSMTLCLIQDVYTNFSV